MTGQLICIASATKASNVSSFNILLQAACVTRSDFDRSGFDSFLYLVCLR